MNLKFVQTIIVELENEPQIFYIDPIEQKVFDSSLKEASQEITSFILDKINEPQSDDVPLEELYEVLNTERKLSEENDKHIFRRN